MNDPYFQELFADRIGGVNYGKSNEIYKFEKIKRAKRLALSEHPDRMILDFGIGENDSMADETVRNRMKVEVDCPENRGYADNGIPEFKNAASRFMKEQFQGDIDSDNELNHAIGSKPALAMIPACFINPGDITLMTTPGYPVAGTHTRYFGGSVHQLQLRADNGFLPDLKSIPDEICKRAKLLVLNYPNSPTGAIASHEFFADAVEFALQNNIVIVHDAAHILLTYNHPSLSFLAIPGAKEVGIEIHSLSKGFNMIGWRIGWVCGNARIVQAFSDVKDNSDSGQFIAVQKSAIAALERPQIFEDTRNKYQRRLTKLISVLNSVGFDVQMPGGTYFLYTPIPRGTSDGLQFDSAEIAAEHLITQQSIVTVPWDDADPYLRFSVTYEADNPAEEDALMEETKKRLLNAKLTF